MSTPAPHRGIIVGVDGSPASKVAVDWAARDAAMRKIPLAVVNVIYPPAGATFPETWMPIPPEYTAVAGGRGTHGPQRRAQDHRGQRETARSDQR